MARNTSDAYKQQVQGTREFCVKVVIVYPDNTVDTLTELSDFMKIKIEDACSSDSDFEIGAAIINEATITLNNRTGKFIDRNFYGAKLTVYVGIKVNGLPELLKMGVYTVDEPASPGISINLVAYDNMVYTDKKYVPGITFPASLKSIARDACGQCGLTLKDEDFPRSDYMVQPVPEDGHTCREVLAAIAQLSGCFARCDNDGYVEIRWYSADTDFEISGLRNKSICTDDVAITGIQVDSGSDASALAGEDGYRLVIKDNFLLESGNEQETADYLAGKLVGMTFRPLSVSCKSDPSMEAGDRIRVTDETGMTYETVITSTTFAVQETQNVACNAASPTVNSGQRLSQTARAIIRSKKYTQEYVAGELNERDEAIKNMAERLAASSGLFVTEVEQEDGSYIYYAHDKQNLSDSGVVIKFTREAFGISTDGGETYPYGFTVTGEMITRLLHTVGVNADWINTGSLTARDADGNVVFSVNVETGEVAISASSIRMSSSKTVEETISNIEGKKMYRTELVVEGTSIFRDKGQMSRLSCRVLSWDKDITATLPDSAFEWHRKSGNAETDADWDGLHKGMKSVTISTEDVCDNASFYCEVNI